MPFFLNEETQVESISLPFSLEKCSSPLVIHGKCSLSQVAKQMDIPSVKKPNSILFISNLHYLHLCNLRYQ